MSYKVRVVELEPEENDKARHISKAIVVLDHETYNRDFLTKIYKKTKNSQYFGGCSGW